MASEVKDQLGRRVKDLRISLTDRCNLRCQYCMPKEIFGRDYPFLRKSEWLRFAELDEIVNCFVGLGVEKIRLTGGEPLLRPGLVKYVSGLRHFHPSLDIALTTNGIRLAEMAEDLKSAGLTRVTVSLDALDDQIFGSINGRGIGSKVVVAGIERALGVGLPVKVNMVVQKGVNESEILPVAKLCKQLRVNLRFIEFMDVGNHNKWDQQKVLSMKEIYNLLSAEFPLKCLDATSSKEVAKRYSYEDGTEVGFVSSVTQPFCSSCTRARISADGKLYTCLFASQGLDLKSFLRSTDFSSEKLWELISSHWQKREDRYSELRQQNQSSNKKKIEMFYIGG